MPATINVPGTVKIETTAVAGGTTYADLGYPPGDELFNFEEYNENEPVYTGEKGGVPADWVYTGSYCVIPVTLTKWDATELTALRKRCGATNEGEPGTIGFLWVQDATTTKGAFAMKLTPPTKSATTPQYIFGRCVITEPIRLFEFGVAPSRIAFTVTAIPDASGDVYTKSTS